jgi:hypothetical protein
LFMDLLRLISHVSFERSQKYNLGAQYALTKGVHLQMDNIIIGRII